MASYVTGIVFLHRLPRNCIVPSCTRPQRICLDSLVAFGSLPQNMSPEPLPTSVGSEASQPQIQPLHLCVPQTCIRPSPEPAPHVHKKKPPSVWSQGFDPEARLNSVLAGAEHCLANSPISRMHRFLLKQAATSVRSKPQATAGPRAS